MAWDVLSRDVLSYIPFILPDKFAFFFCHLFIFFRITLPLKQILSGIAPVPKSIHFDLAQYFVGSD